jgi:hypothetical protein
MGCHFFERESASLGTVQRLASYAEGFVVMTCGQTKLSMGDLRVGDSER